MFVLTCLSLGVKLFQSKGHLSVEACVVRHKKFFSFLYFLRFFFVVVCCFFCFFVKIVAVL